MTTLEPRAARGLALILASALALAAVIAVTVRPGAHAGPARARAPQPDLASSMEWISARVGWVSALDRQAGTSTLFHTTDAGRHWARLRVAPAVESVGFFDPEHGVLTSLGPPWAGASSPLPATYLTSDGGRRWQRLALPGGAEAQRPAFADARHAWVWDPAPGALYATADAGAHWRRLAGLGLPAADPVPGTISFRDPLHGWLAAPAGSPAPTLYVTSDGGETWRALPLPPPDGGWPAGDQLDPGPAVVAADGSGQLVTGELQHWGYGLVALSYWVAATADAGVTWSAPRRLPEVGFGAVVTIATSRAAGSISWAWSADELLVTRDGGNRWATVAVPAGWTLHGLSAIDGDTAWVAASVSDGRGDARWALFSTADGGATWTEAPAPSLDGAP